MVLFNETLGYNVRYGAKDLEVSDEQVVAALRAARLEELVNDLWQSGEDTPD